MHPDTDSRYSKCPKKTNVRFKYQSPLAALAEMSDGLMALQTHRDDVGVDSRL